eukprot:2244041-Prymnesium_polylepis.1
MSERPRPPQSLGGQTPARIPIGTPIACTHRVVSDCADLRLVDRHREWEPAGRVGEPQQRLGHPLARLAQVRAPEDRVDAVVLQQCWLRDGSTAEDDDAKRHAPRARRGGERADECRLHAGQPEIGPVGILLLVVRIEPAHKHDRVRARGRGERGAETGAVGAVPIAARDADDAGAGADELAKCAEGSCPLEGCAVVRVCLHGRVVGAGAHNHEHLCRTNRTRARQDPERTL